MMPPRRRVSDARWYVRTWDWVTAPFVDGQEGLSLTRILSVFYAVIVWHSVESEHGIGLNALWLALASIACAFGKSSFSFLLRRINLMAEVRETSTRTTAESRTIEERRDYDSQIEPSP